MGLFESSPRRPSLKDSLRIPIDIGRRGMYPNGAFRGLGVAHQTNTGTGDMEKFPRHLNDQSQGTKSGWLNEFPFYPVG